MRVALALVLAGCATEEEPCGGLEERPAPEGCNPGWVAERLCCDSFTFPSPCFAQIRYDGADGLTEVECGVEDACIDWLVSCEPVTAAEP